MRPQPTESAPFYHGYIDKVPGDNGLGALFATEQQLQAIFSEMTEAQWSHRYAPGKWSPKELLGHLIDTERIFAYRALCIARGDQTPLPGFEQDDYVATGRHHERSPESLLKERKAVRESTHLLFETFSQAQLSQLGTASNAPVTPRAILFILAGHDLHHLSVLKDRYL